MKRTINNKVQVLLIHGGMTFKKKKDYLYYLKTKEISTTTSSSWSGMYLKRNLGRLFEIVRPRMPLAENAEYEDWKIIFERYISLLQYRVVLIGESLGGIFLANIYLRIDCQ